MTRKARRGPPLWLAVWSDKTAYALDAWPHEVKTYTADLKRRGDNVAGPFSSAKQALQFAANKMIVAKRNKIA